MKFILALALIATATPAFAADAPPAVPTGYQVAGCTFYRIALDQKLVQVCDPNAIKDLLKDGVSPPTYSNAFNSGGSGAGN